MRISAVLFDLYGTLLLGGTAVQRDQTSAQTADALGVDRDCFIELFRGTTRQRFSGEMGSLNETLRALAHRLGATPTDAAVRLAEVTRLRDCRKWLWPASATLSIVERLRRDGLRLGLVSNCSAETVALWPQQPLAEHFSALGFSCTVGVNKPDPAIFRKVCGDLGVEPQQCAYVGDGDSDELAAASALGMRAIQTTQHVRSDPAWPGERVSHLSLLPELLLQ